MYPILFEWPFKLHTFGVLVLLGALAGLHWIKRESIRLGLDHEKTGGVAVESFMAGLIGSRVFFVIMNWSKVYAPMEGLGPYISPFLPWEGGLVWYGGPLAGVPMALWRMRVYKLRSLVVADVFAPGLVLGHAIGRIGCLMAGDDHGKPWTPNMWWPEWATVTFTHKEALVSPPEWKNVALLPSQPLMTLGKLVIFTVLVLVRKRLMPVHPGCLAALYFTLYSIERFLVEFTRGDLVRGVYEIGPFTLSTSQVISLAVFPVALSIFVYLWRRPLDPEPEAPKGETTGTPGATAVDASDADPAKKQP